MNKKQIAILGGGNIGTAIYEGLITSEAYTKSDLIITRKKHHCIEYTIHDRIEQYPDNKKAVRESEMIIIAVQPRQLNDLLADIKTELDPQKHILVSIVTGENIQSIKKRINKEIPIFRVMPNTAIAIQESMTFVACKHNSVEQRDYVISMLEKLGKVLLIEEDLMLAATVLGACGIAYALRFVRAASQGGIEIGFDANISQEIAAQTVKGAASLLITHGTHPESEIDKVTTPRGYTIAGLNEMEHQGFSSALIKGISASFKKIE